jgi:hypothetical protein
MGTTMKPYSVLNALPAESFRNPAQFVTDWDVINPDQAATQYAEGLETGRNAERICIGVNSVWSALLKSGASVHSHEGIGYHAHTASLLRGFLDSGAPVIVYRWTDGGITETRIN